MAALIGRFGFRPSVVWLAFGIAVVGPVSAAAGQDKRPITFTKDVAPILQEKCVQCHRPGEMAPMSLRTFQEVRPWARSIKNKVSKREMPPWFIDRNIGITIYGITFATEPIVHLKYCFS